VECGREELEESRETEGSKEGILGIQIRQVLPDELARIDAAGL
jgi:hypothetical protein